MRRLRWLAVAAAAVAVVVAGRGVDAGAGAAAAPDAEQVAAFRQQLEPVAYDWGRLEVQGMRPSVHDLQLGEGLPAETIAGQVPLWLAELAAIDARLARLPADGALAGVRADLRRALRDYEAAAQEFRRAAAITGDGRAGAIRAGIAKAERGAATFSAAQRALDALATAAGLEPREDVG